MGTPHTGAACHQHRHQPQRQPLPTAMAAGAAASAAAAAAPTCAPLQRALPVHLAAPPLPIVLVAHHPDVAPWTLRLAIAPEALIHIPIGVDLGPQAVLQVGLPAALVPRAVRGPKGAKALEAGQAHALVLAELHVWCCSAGQLARQVALPCWSRSAPTCMKPWCHSPW